MKIRSTVLAGITMMAMASCQQTGGDQKTADSRKLLDPANIDSTVRPGENFFMYANGAWLKNNPIPASETRWGSFNELQENNLSALKALLEEAAANTGAKEGSKERKIGDFYKSGMDSAAIEQAGVQPLQEVYSRIDAIKDANGVMKEVAMEHTQGLDPLFGFSVSPDDKQVTKEICQFYQGGLGMPDRDYYFDKDDRTTKIRDAYKKYLVDMLSLMGDNAAAQKDAADIFALESKLAGASMTRVEQRDPYKLYNKFSPSTAPGLNWSSLLTDLKVQNQDSMIVGMPVFFKEIGTQLTATPVEVWKKYLKFHVTNDMSGFLASRFDKLHFEFYGTTLRGQKEQRPRWKRVLSIVDGSVGELLGEVYVAKHFKPEAKQRMLELLKNLQDTYADRIKRLDWMSQPTKEKALAKLNTFMKKIGYPDKWRSYDNLTVVNNNYVKNILNASAFEYDYTIGKLGKAVDRTEWGMTPPTVNAYYNPAFNEIVFPAGILQYPFFDFGADDAVNYGGIGGVIGHEMTHGFDDQGRQYDADGNLHDWWTPQDAENFTKRADVVIKQYDESTVLDSVHVNGHLTIGENLADLGGINIAYEAFKKTKQGKSNEKIDGFTGDQRFFLSWAQVWRANTRPEELVSRIKTDPHSPSELRCNIPVSNMPEFYQAFGIKPGDKMYRPENERAKVW